MEFSFINQHTLMDGKNTQTLMQVLENFFLKKISFFSTKKLNYQKN
jgi:hypothetical protein